MISLMIVLIIVIMVLAMIVLTIEDPSSMYVCHGLTTTNLIPLATSESGESSGIQTYHANHNKISYNINNTAEYIC